MKRPSLASILVLAALVAPDAPLHAQAGNTTPTTTADAQETLTSGKVSYFWRTRAEKSQYRQTADYDETMRFVRQIEGSTQWMRVTSYGKSGQGRDLPLVILSKDRLFTPEAVRASGKPIVLIQCGIHSGEIEGKDAMLALMRDMVALRTRPQLLDSAVVLVMPIFSVDAHERRSRWNRINQNGPEDMGWRSNPIGLNLNRDYVKAETPEMRAFLGGVWTKWWPHLLVDTHTTDGADYQYDLTYAANHGAGVAPSVDRWLAEAFESRILARAVAMGHVIGPYMSFKGADPRSGLEYGNAGPRLSNGFTHLSGRPSILVETHMLKPYGVRVHATYDLLVAILEEINARPRALTRAVADAEAEIVRRGQSASPAARSVVLTTRLSGVSQPFSYRGVAATWTHSDLLNDLVPQFTSAPWDTVIPLYRETVPDLTVDAPVGYVIPQEWTACRDRLDLHAVGYRRFAKAWSDTVEVYRVAEWRAERELREGHYPTVVSRVERLRQKRTYRPGDLWVPLDQPTGTVAVFLFEPQSPDGLTYWNAFDTVLMQKEYTEDYVIEPIARKMLAEDPALRKEFETRVASDTTFAKSPWLRRNFFFTRSAWKDPEQNLIPVARAIRRPPETVLAP